MAIFMASTKTITRSKGQSAVASASYRAGEELEDKRYGKTHDYSKRTGVMSADIILPSALQNQNITIERAELWNLAEETETRKNSRVAREWLVNLPYELDEQTRKELAHEFTQALTDKFGTIADCAIHRPTEKEIERGADDRNFHAHIMLTTRKAELTDDGKIKFTDKADCEVSDSQRKKMGLSKAKDEVTEIRQLWETLANEKLLEHGHQIIDSRSYESQGIDILPQIKMGSVATKLERDGKKTMRGEINRAITERNELVFSQELAENKRINDKADLIIFESRKRDIEQTPPPPTKAIGDGSPIQATTTEQPTPTPKTEKPKTEKPKLDAVAQALALAGQVKDKRKAEETEKALALAEQKRAERAEQAKREQAMREQIRQQQAEHKRIAEQKAQQRAEQLEQEQQQFKEDQKELLGSAYTTATAGGVDNDIDMDKTLGQRIQGIRVADEYVKNLQEYKDDPRTTERQKKLAGREQERMTALVTDQSKNALQETKDLYYTSERKAYGKALQTAVSDFTNNNKQSMSQDQQQDLQKVQTAVENFNQEINYSRSYGMGR